MDTSGVAVVLMSVVLSLVVLLIGRELVCWYFKLNTMIGRLELIEGYLANMNKNLELLADNSEEQLGAVSEAQPEAKP